ncbi:MAG: methylated-DNA--[protein]-cysteine S-methyltransferase [Alphaproteobacteria bacterium]|nr:methylated-DNA--[protein]-cysteine S-methyltransferase [Alphaproteobacteria bacterium]
MTNNLLKILNSADFKSYFKDNEILYGFHSTPFGEALVLTTSLGICGLAFTAAFGRQDCLKDMKNNYKSVSLVESLGQTQLLIDLIFSAKPVPLLIHGTPFQIKVWQALLTIPKGKVVSYEDIAKMIGMPQTYRAVANAIGRNPISYLIPCHRIVRKSGALGGYRWGLELKVRLLQHENTDS